MRLTEQWIVRPQGVLLRKCLFQIHLWTGIGLGIYVLLISLSGSAVVFRNEIFKSFGSAKHVVAIGPRLSRAQLKQAALRAFPNYSVGFIWENRNPDEATQVWLDRAGKIKARLFDPYSGQDLGDSSPLAIRVMASLVDFHTNLWLGKTGRKVNGVGAIFTTLLVITGAAIWWPGIGSWRNSAAIDWRTNWRRLNWNLHSVIGIWALAFVLVWGVTGVYVAFPRPFQKAVNLYFPLRTNRLDLSPPAAVERAVPSRPSPVKLSSGDKILRWLYYLHFGDFAGTGVKLIWVLFGLAPPFLFFTGLIMWWNRVLSRIMARGSIMGGGTTEARGMD